MIGAVLFCQNQDKVAIKKTAFAGLSISLDHMYNRDMVQ